MSLVSDSSSAESAKKTAENISGVDQKRSTLFNLPRNVYVLLFFTMGKGFQLSIAALNLNLYVHSLGYHPDFVGIFSAMPALGAMVGAVPIGLLSDRIGRKPVLVMTALLTPIVLALVGLATAAPMLLALNFVQGLVSTAYWVTNLPLLTENTTQRQRVGVLALNSFLLLGIGALGNLLGGAVPELVAGMMHVPANSAEPLRWGVFLAASFTLIFGLPLWFLREKKRGSAVRGERLQGSEPVVAKTGEMPVVRARSQVKPQAPVLL
ncbi:MAG: MFS transporter, partial [Ktedonobacteraceae bacterium]|nr:MFS transporter [Ktedonobacteraceae bacterium]